MSAPRQAVVLAAGEGRRLRPLTDRLPKPLVPVGGRPLLERTLAGLARAGVRRAAVNAHHLADRVVAFCSGLRLPGLELHVEVEPVLLGTGGALGNLRGWIADEPLLLVAGDVVAEVDLAGLGARHADCDAHATMTLVPDADVTRFGAVATDAGGRITDIVGALGVGGAREAVNGSVHVLSPAFVRRFEARPACLVRDGYLPALREGARCVGFDHDGPWHETGTPEGLAAADAALRAAAS